LPLSSYAPPTTSAGRQSRRIRIQQFANLLSKYSFTSKQTQSLGDYGPFTSPLLRLCGLQSYAFILTSLQAFKRLVQEQHSCKGFVSSAIRIRT